MIAHVAAAAAAVAASTRGVTAATTTITIGGTVPISGPDGVRLRRTRLRRVLRARQLPRGGARAHNYDGMAVEYAMLDALRRAAEPAGYYPRGKARFVRYRRGL